MPDPHMLQIDISFFIKLLVAFIAGAIIGLERQWRGKPAGIRTSCLICIGTMLFIHLSILISPNTADQARVLAQLITGIGFLGAGVILTKDGLLHGVTSAAIIWSLAAIGACVGFGYYSLAMITVGAIIAILIGIEYLENMFKTLQRGVHKHITMRKRTKGEELGGE